MSDLYIKEASALMDQAKDALSSGATQVKGMAENVDIHKLLPYLLAGGAGAVGGAALSGRRKERQGETRGQYLTRILRNAVTAGALTGVGSYAVGEGLKKTVGKIDLENPITGTAEDQGPLAAGARRHLFSPLAAVGAGALGLGLTAGGKKIGATSLQSEGKLLDMLKQTHGGQLPGGVSGLGDLVAKKKTDPTAYSALLSGAADPRYEDLKGGGKKMVFPGRASDPNVASEIRRLAAASGLNVHDAQQVSELPRPLRKLLGPANVAKIFGGKGPKGVRSAMHELGRPPSALLGRTTGRRLGRGAIGLGASIIPAVIGSILTDRPE